MRIWKLGILVLVGGVAFSPTPLSGQGRERGKHLFGVCAACHGAHGEGGGGGVYPRLAGLPTSYVAEQLRAFKARERLNVPMLMFCNDRELPESAIFELSDYIGSLQLVTRPVPPGQVTGTRPPRNPARPSVEIPRAPGDVETGSAVYTLGCARCHGPNGWGDATVPQLAGQHTRYLAAQFDHYLASKRAHPEAEALFNGLGDSMIRDLLAFLSTRGSPHNGPAGNRWGPR